MAFLQREFLPSNDTYKTKTSAGKTLKLICDNENVTYSAQGETAFFGGNFLFRISKYTKRERECSFRKLKILNSQTTDSQFANYRFSIRKLQIFISQTTDFHFVSQTTVSRRIDVKFSELVVGELTLWRNDRLPIADKSRIYICWCMVLWWKSKEVNIWTCSIDENAVSHTFVGQNETLHGHSGQAKSHKLTEEVMEYNVRCTNPFCQVLVAR